MIRDSRPCDPEDSYFQSRTLDGVVLKQYGRRFGLFESDSKSIAEFFEFSNISLCSQLNYERIVNLILMLKKPLSCVNTFISTHHE